MPKTVLPHEISDADRPFEYARTHADGSVTLYYQGDDIPPMPVAVASCPAEVTMRQAQLALLAAGKLAAVDAAINALPEPTRTAARITWDRSSTVQRSNGLVSQLGPALGLTEAQIDALFVAAEKL